MQAALFRHPDWQAFDRGEISEQALAENLVARTRRRPEEIARLLSGIRCSLTAKPDTVAVLDELRARGVPLYCLSNMPDPMFQYVRERYPFFQAFRGIVISAHVKLAKPQREIYEHLLDRFGLDAAQTAFIDDRAQNVGAARAVGLHAIRFIDAQNCKRAIADLLKADRVT